MVMSLAEIQLMLLISLKPCSPLEIDAIFQKAQSFPVMSQQFSGIYFKVSKLLYIEFYKLPISELPQISSNCWFQATAGSQLCSSLEMAHSCKELPHPRSYLPKGQPEANGIQRQTSVPQYNTTLTSHSNLVLPSSL